MNSTKLTNALLIALIAINGLLLAGCALSSMHHHRHRGEFAMQYKFRGRHHDSFSFYRFGANRGYHRGRYCGSFRNQNYSGWN